MNNNKISLPDSQTFNKDLDGKQTGLYILRNKNNVFAAVTNYGARWVSMLVPGKNGNVTDVIVGFDSLDGYLNSTEAYYGAVVGRYANRIAAGKFYLDGNSYTLAINNPPNHLHGGIKAFHAVVWDVVQVTDNRIELKYISPDGEEGYPGKLEITMDYNLTDENEMRISFSAFTDKATVISLAHHAYFNLNGNGTILEHNLKINADHYTPIDNTSIPLGFLEKVEGTAFDFRDGMKIGSRIHEPAEQLTNGNGYDHNFVLNTHSLDELAAEATGDISGIKMGVFTTEPGMQLYTGNFMKRDNILKNNNTDGRHEAFCLETQHFPDSPNQPDFPSVILRPGEMYSSCTGFLFSISN